MPGTRPDSTSRITPPPTPDTAPANTVPHRPMPCSTPRSAPRAANTASPRVSSRYSSRLSSLRRCGSTNTTSAVAATTQWSGSLTTLEGGQHAHDHVADGATADGGDGGQHQHADQVEALAYRHERAGGGEGEGTDPDEHVDERHPGSIGDGRPTAGRPDARRPRPDVAILTACKNSVPTRC